MLSSLLNFRCLRSHQWLYQKAHQQYKPGRRTKSAIYQKNAPSNWAAVLHHAAARIAGYESFIQKAASCAQKATSGCLHEEWNSGPWKALKRIGRFQTFNAESTSQGWSGPLGQDQVCDGTLRPVQSQHLPWSGGSCTGQWAACSHGRCQALKHRKWGTCYSASQKVTDVHLHSTEHSLHFCPLDRAVSP